MKIYNHELKEVELDSFFWIDELGWCFDWYDNEEMKEIDCKTYGRFPLDFVTVDGDKDVEYNVKEFLSHGNKEFTGDDIPVINYFKWINLKNKTR